MRNSFLKHAAVPAWAGLMAVTALSWWLSGDPAAPDDARRLTFALVLALAFVKVQLVGEYFMEVRHAPRALRLTFLAWVLLTGTAVVMLSLRS